MPWTDPYLLVLVAAINWWELSVGCATGNLLIALFSNPLILSEYYVNFFTQKRRISDLDEGQTEMGSSELGPDVLTAGSAEGPGKRHPDSRKYSLNVNMTPESVTPAEKVL